MRRFFAVLGLAAVMLPLASAADVPSGKPLLVIRFNQPHVYFQKPLSIAVTRAEQAKPGVVYDVVSYTSPNAAVSGNLDVVLGTMISMGVPRARIKAMTQASGSGEEIHIFVR